MSAVTTHQRILLTLAITTAVASNLFAQSPSSPPQSLSSSTTLPAAQAEIKCLHKVQIAAQSDGLIDGLFAEEGSLVKKGDILLKIDNRLAIAELEVAKKELEAAEAQAKQTAHIDFAVKSRDVANAEYKDLRDVFEQSRAAAYSEVRKKLLEAELAAAGVKVAEVDHQKDQSAAKVAAEKVKAAGVQLELRQVTAPYDGVIVERMRDAGEWVKAGEPVFRLLNLSEMKVEAMINANGHSLSQLQNAPMKVRIDIGNGQFLNVDARIDFVSSQIDIDRTVRVWARLQNQLHGDMWLLRDGMHGTVEISVSQPALTARR